MAKDGTSERVILQLRAVLRDISPTTSGLGRRCRSIPPSGTRFALPSRRESGSVYRRRYRQVWLYARFIDSVLANLLDSVRLSQHAAMMKRFKSYQQALPSVGSDQIHFGNTDMSVWAARYFQCYQSGILL
jgi:hypothetical protein